MELKSRISFQILIRTSTDRTQMTVTSVDILPETVDLRPIWLDENECRDLMNLNDKKTFACCKECPKPQQNEDFSPMVLGQAGISHAIMHSETLDKIR